MVDFTAVTVDVELTNLDNHRAELGPGLRSSWTGVRSGMQGRALKARSMARTMKGPLVPFSATASRVYSAPFALPNSGSGEPGGRHRAVTLGPYQPQPGRSRSLALEGNHEAS